MTKPVAPHRLHRAAACRPGLARGTAGCWPAGLLFLALCAPAAQAQIVIGGDGGSSAVTIDQGVLDALGPPSGSGGFGAPATGAPATGGPATGGPVNIRPAAPPAVHPQVQPPPHPPAAQTQPAADPAMMPEPEMPEPAMAAPDPASGPVAPPPDNAEPESADAATPSADVTGADAATDELGGTPDPAAAPEPLPIATPAPTAPFEPPLPGARPPAQIIQVAAPPVVPEAPATTPDPVEPAPVATAPAATDGQQTADTDEMPAAVDPAPAAPAIPDNDGVVAEQRPGAPAIPDQPAIVAASPPAAPATAIPDGPAVPDEPQIVAAAPPAPPQILQDRPAEPGDGVSDLAGLAETETQLASVPPQTPTPSTPATEEIVSIPFAPEAEAVPDAAAPTLDALADRMTADPGLRVQVLAYATGGSGSAARSISLSRAIAIRSFLMDRDIRRTRIDVRALGDTAQGGEPDRIDLVIAP